MAYDMEPSSENEARLASFCPDLSQYSEQALPQVRKCCEAASARGIDLKKLVLYGTSIWGQRIAHCFRSQGVDFYGFCGRGAAKFPNGLMGKPVISPEKLFQRSQELYVAVTAPYSKESILNILRSNHFPEDHIVYCFDFFEWLDIMYFEFPELFRKGTAFIDGGCLNCDNSFHFAEWCNGDYSHIFAFEPDPNCYALCQKRLLEKDIKNFHLIQAGLMDTEGASKLTGSDNGLRHGPRRSSETDEDSNTIRIQTTTIDKIVADETVGFIKLEIVGAEFRALHGAKETIVRDKPLLAVSVYHNQGDMLPIMDYLHQLVPEYHFWLRHYNKKHTETVLYASVDSIKNINSDMM